MYWTKTNMLVKQVLPLFEWSRRTPEKTIYLTFDDGPHPDITPFVLEQLEKHQAKATFFCVGENVSRFPDTFADLQKSGHAIGNHTQNHLNGWQQSDETYFENIEACHQTLLAAGLMLPPAGKMLFRPPYGRLTIMQARILRPQYRLIMWDVLTGDFDPKLSPQNCIINAIRNTENGSIVVFHDSTKAEKNLRYVLPRYLTYFGRAGYKFEHL